MVVPAQRPGVGRGDRLEHHGRGTDVKSGLTVEAIPARCYYALRPQERPGCQLTATVAYGTTTLCSACQRDRSTLGKGQSPRPLPSTTNLDALALLDQAHLEFTRAAGQLPAAIARARQHHATWTAIAAVLGITRQAAQQRSKAP